MKPQTTIGLPDPFSQVVFAIPTLYLTLTLAIAHVSPQYHSYFVNFLSMNDSATLVKVSFSKSIMFGIGYLCSFFFFLSYNIYILWFFSEIWNKYFVAPNDNLWLQFLIVIQLLDCGLVIYLPQYWYLSVTGAYIVHLLILRARYNKCISKLENKGVRFDDNDLELFKTTLKKRFNGEPELITQFILLRFCWRRFVFFGLFFGMPFVSVMAVSHGIRHYTGNENFEWMVTGWYTASSMLFTILFFFYIILQLGVMSRTTERIQAKDYDYFLRIVR
jgi:hypothetical protein